MNKQVWIKSPPRNVVAAVVVILIATVFDAIRDGYYGHGWLQYHIPKWIAFYTPLLFIALEHLRAKTAVVLGIASWILWSVALEITPAPWDGSFIKLCKLLIEWINSLICWY